MASKIPSLFVFQRRGRAVNLRADQKIQDSTDRIQRAMTAPLKNKKRCLGEIVRAINRPPLRGLEQSAPSLASTRSHFIPHLTVHFIGLAKKRPFRRLTGTMKCCTSWLLVLQNENCS